MDFLTELAKEVVSKLGDLIVESTVQQFKYLIQHKKITNNLKEELKRLKDMKQALQRWVDAESKKGYEIAPFMKNWLSSVAAIENELQSFYENEVNKNKKCLGGKCRDLAFDYSLGKRATKSTEYITSLKEEGKNFPFIYSYPKAPPSFGSTLFAKDIMCLESRNKIILEVIEKLKDDKFKRISICGMGGVGKTTLVNELIKIIEKGKLFDEIMMVTVSEKPDYEKIQRQVIGRLGMKFEKDSTMQVRAMQLLERLNKANRVIIVLDDVWAILDFERIGLPSREHQKACKILFTSRDQKVCQKMGSQVEFQVSVLLEDEAWHLFREMTGDVVDKPDINRIAKKVAKECGGLPLAIVTVGRALCNEEKLVWEVALEQLRNSQFSDMQEYVYSRIELSFKFLGSEEHKSCLLLCSLFPEDFDISVESLLRHGVGLGLFEAVDAIWKTRNQVNYLVNNLKRCFLLLDSNKPGCVKMHDVVRDAVLKIASRENGISAQGNVELKRLKQKQGKWVRMSLILDEKIELENGLECPTLELLQVHSQRSIPWPENFIHGISKLKVLAMQNLHIPKVSSLFQASVNLHTLQVEGCHVGDISVIGKELKNLEILSFSNSDIKELPAEIGQLGFLRLLDLTGCNCLNFISPNVLARLSRLEELYFRVRNFSWILNEDALKELRYLSKLLKVLEIKVRKVKNLPDDLIFENLEKFWVYVVPHTFYECHGYLESNILQLRAVDYNSIKNSSMTMQLVKKCEILILEKVKDLKNIIYELDDKGLQCVKDLRLNSCPNLECVLDCNTTCCAFPLIKSLSLKNLTELRGILHASDHHEIKKTIIEFSYLEKLELEDLPNLIGFSRAIDFNEPHQPIHHGMCSATKLTDSTNIEDGEILLKSYSESVDHRPSHISAKLFSSIWIKQFPKLETLFLKNCKSLEMVFDLEGYSESNGHALALLFPQLREMELSYLKKLSYVWGNVPQCVQGFQHLRFLTISNCDSLKHVFTSSIVREIMNLEELKVSSCELIENLVVWSKDNEKDDKKGHVTNIGFIKLYSLSLSGLPKLVSICSNSLKLECPSLRLFEIDDCPVLEISLLPTHIHAKQDNLDVIYSANTEDIGFHSFKENNTRSSDCALVCTPFLRKFIHQGNTNKRSTKEVLLTLARDNAPSILEMKSKKEKVQMPTLEDICVKKCDMLDVLFFLGEKYNFSGPSHLKTIKIIKCNKLKAIVARREERKDMINSFARLESLHLEKLPNLVKICFFGTYESWDKQQDMDECEGDHGRIRRHLLMDELLFPNLTSLLIEACNKINILFSRSSLSSLKHLEKLEVSYCVNMEEIISHEEIEESANKIMFHRLQCLLLKGLPNLKAFCQGPYNFDFPSLQIVLIKDCPSMEVFTRGFSNTPKLEDVTMENVVKFCFSRTYESWNKQQDKDKCGQDHVRIKRQPLLDGSSFSTLTSLHIEACNKINILFSHSSLSSLQYLEKLEVWHCKNMEEIISQEEIEASAKKIMFPRLQHLSLQQLPNLKAFCLGSYNFYFPSLQKVLIRDCPNMEVFSQGFSDTPKLEDVSIKIESLTNHYIQKKDMNATIQGFKAFVALQRSEVLRWTELYNKSMFGYFGNESTMNITTFHKLLMFVSLNEIQMLQHVRELIIMNCDSLVEVFESGGGGEGEGTKKRDATTHYQLQRMILVHLPKLSHIWKCNIMEVVSFQKLTLISIENCHKLKSLFSHSLAKSLVQLQRLEVTKCDMMEEIVTKEDESTEGGSKVKILFPELKTLMLKSLPKLKCVCSGDYDYDLPLCNVGEDKEMNNDNKIQISFPQLMDFCIFEVPKLKCFCSGAYDYGIMISSIKGHPKLTTFPHRSVIVSAPNIHQVYISGLETYRFSKMAFWVLTAIAQISGDLKTVYTFGDLNLTIHYIQNSEKYKVELQRLETFKGIEQDERLLGYIKRVTKLYLTNCHKLLNCVPSNMMHLFSHVKNLIVQECECLEEIFEYNDYDGESMMQYELQLLKLFSLPKLQHIWKNHGQILGFQKLREITISQCHDLKYVFSDVSMATSLPNLYELELFECNKIEEIIQNNSIHISMQEQQRAKIIFPCLDKIELGKLPNLKYFCASSFPCYVGLPQCHSISIKDCQEMQTFWYKGTLDTPHLKNLSVENTKFDVDVEEVNEVIQHRKWL